MIHDSHTYYSIRQAELSEFCGALAHPGRVAILEAIANQDTCIEGKVVGINQLSPFTVGTHLRYLKKAGLIKGTLNLREGLCYCVDWDKLEDFKTLFDAFYIEMQENKERVLSNKGTCLK